jgi:hypothetical protein
VRAIGVPIVPSPTNPILIAILNEAKGLERCLREVRADAQHVCVCVTPTNFEIAGQLALGFDLHQSVWAIDDREDTSPSVPLTFSPSDLQPF